MQDHNTVFMDYCCSTRRWIFQVVIQKIYKWIYTYTHIRTQIPYIYIYIIHVYFCHFHELTIGTQSLQLKGADMFWIINSICRLLYLIYIIASNFLTLFHTCSFHMNDLIKCIQQGIIICSYLDIYSLIKSLVIS